MSMKKFALSIVAAAAVTLPASSAFADNKIKLKLRNQHGEIVFDCGTINIHKTVGLATPGTVLITRNAPMAVGKVSRKTQAYINKCLQGSQVIYAGHTDPMLQIGVGIHKQLGGGDSNINVYGSQAISGSSSGASAGATAGVKVK